jgi:hypothetical protein
MKRIILAFLLFGLCKTLSAQPPTITQNLNNIPSCSTYGSTVAYVGATNATTYTWQVSMDGGNTWTVLTNGANYNVSTPGTLYMNTDPTWNGYKYWCILSNSYGSDTSAIGTLYIATGAPNSPVFLIAPIEVCQGSTQEFRVTNISEADSVHWFDYQASISPNNVLDDSIVLINFSSSNSPQTVSVNSSNHCAQNYTLVHTTVTVNPLQSTPSGTAGAGASCARFSVFPGMATTYSDATCNPIAAVTPSGTSPVSGTIQSCVTLAASVPSFNGVPYVPRYYNIEPAVNASTSTATVTLYFTQADFDAYNAAAAGNPLLPTGPSDATGISNLLISQFHGTGTTPDTYGGGSGQINPADNNIGWNATASRWEVTFSITGFSGFFVSGSPIVSLPLTLTNFSGKAEAGGNVLSWITASEQNTAYFEVQRSVTGASSFQDLGQVAAAGNSEQSLQYGYTDAFAGPSHPAYSYRLKMADLDGKYTYSPIVTLRPLVAALTISVSPNPFTQPTSLVVSSPAAGNAVLSVTDMSGQRLVVRNVILQQGDNALDPSLIARLPQGLYVISVATQTQQETIKFVKE